MLAEEGDSWAVGGVSGRTGKSGRVTVSANAFTEVTERLRIKVLLGEECELGDVARFCGGDSGGMPKSN